MDTQRIEQNHTGTLIKTFQVDGVATDPSPATATIQIVRDDGTILVPAGTATTRLSTGTFSFNLTTAHTSLLDRLTVLWTSSFGVLTQRVEIVGGFLFSIADARRITPLNNTTDYPTDRIEEARLLAETALEDLCGVAFVPRYARETFSGTGTTNILLRPRASAVRAVTATGVAYTSSELAGLVVQQTGVAYNPNNWASGTGNLTVTYTHGYDTPPPRVSQACLTLAKNWLVKGPLDDRMTSLATDDGTFALLTPGVRGSYTGIPEVDAVVQQYGLAAGIA